MCVCVCACVCVCVCAEIVRNCWNHVTNFLESRICCSLHLYKGTHLNTMLDDDGEDAVTMATKEKVDDVIRTGNLLRTLRSVRARICWGWVVTVASSIMFVVSYGFLYSFGIIMVDLMSEFDSSATDTGKSHQCRFSITMIKSTHAYQHHLSAYCISR